MTDWNLTQFARALATACRLHRNAWHPQPWHEEHMRRVRGIID